MNKEALIIFIKNPVLGAAKTRLAKTIGDQKALEAYLKLLEHTRKVSRKIKAQKFLFYNQFIDEQDEWANHMFSKQLQVKGDLGEKMKAGFDFVFQAGYEKAVIIGSDCGELNHAIIERAFAALDQRDFVIGPALDGGYYLLGMKQFAAFPFENKQWSTSTLFETTVAEIIRKKQSVYQLVALNDVDEYEDWIRWENSVVGNFC